MLVVRGWIPRDMSLPPPVPADHTPRTLTAFYRGGDEKKLFTPDNDPDTRTYYWLDAKELAEMGHAHPLVLVADAGTLPRHLAYIYSDERLIVGAQRPRHRRDTRGEGRSSRSCATITCSTLSPGTWHRS